LSRASTAISTADIANARLSDRLIALATVIMLHAAAFALFLSQRGPPQVPLTPPGLPSVVTLTPDRSVPPAPTAPPPPVLPSKIKEVIELETVELFSTSTDSDALAARATSCFTLELVRDAILADPAAMASVLNSPPHTRSIADAVVLWNAGWSESAASDSSPLGATRAAVERGLAALDRGCLDEPIAGPRLVPIPAGTGTMFVVFGSGNWTWRDVFENRQGTIFAIDPSAQGANGTRTWSIRTDGRDVD
jgi:hypothetical protein